MGSPAAPSRSARLVARLLAAWVVFASARHRGGSEPRTDVSEAPPVPAIPRRARLEILAALTGLTGYLVAMGGVLLALRFAHAGLPVTQALSLVPTTTLVTTAFSEVLVTAIILSAVGLFSGAPYLVTNRAPMSPRDGRRWADRVMDTVSYIAVALVIFVLPFDVYGVVFWLSLVGIVTASKWALPLFRRVASVRQAVWVYVGLLAVLASLPTFARQLGDPLNMETVLVRQPGKTPLLADLVAIRDESIAVSKCGSLLVLPLPAELEVFDERDSQTSSSSLVDRLGVRYDRKPRPPKHPVRCRQAGGN